jgi:hypothetical protein
MDPAELRQQAQRCYRLAKSITDPKAVEVLKEKGDELEARARQLEEESKSKQ